jgi:hypothetical protein
MGDIAELLGRKKTAELGSLSCTGWDGDVARSMVLRVRANMTNSSTVRCSAPLVKIFGPYSAHSFAKDPFATPRR